MKRHRANTGAAALRAGAPTLIAFNKPFGVLCQFSADGDRPTLADHIRLPNLYPAGRLDADSEGLLLLTSDGRLQHRITDPVHKLEKRYWVQVEGEPDRTALAAMEAGLDFDGSTTLPCSAQPMDAPQGLWPRTPPIRIRAGIPTSWLEIRMREGKNRQIRRMTARIGFPTLRLVRHQIGHWRLDALAPGQWRALVAKDGASI